LEAAKREVQSFIICAFDTEEVERQAASFKDSVFSHMSPKLRNPRNAVLVFPTCGR